ncbi:pectinesterase inhibitor 10-like [Hordeum vulgare subsp. vulgare]|uniref:pectinesterase inhibitor 10-like n=1 Tax=Hordeum vulgare subsp. vulgare TaxID=112509 RepID=UPI001D1A3EA3|nr:pectinesterase inhibitor 10-like [Hordeum vulgare subsp. vulgare]
MRKQQASASASSSSSSSTETKPLRRLLRRGPKPPEQEPSLSLPLLRDPNDADMPPASAPTPSPTPPPPVSTSQHQLPPKIRLTAAQGGHREPATAPPGAGAAHDADSRATSLSSPSPHTTPERRPSRGEAGEGRGEVDPGWGQQIRAAPVRIWQ